MVQKHKENLELKLKALSTNVSQSLENLAHKEEEIKAAIAKIRKSKLEEDKPSPRFKELLSGKQKLNLKFLFF